MFPNYHTHLTIFEAPFTGVLFNVMLFVGIINLAVKIGNVYSGKPFNIYVYNYLYWIAMICMCGAMIAWGETYDGLILRGVYNSVKPYSTFPDVYNLSDPHLHWLLHLFVFVGAGSFISGIILSAKRMVMR